MEHEYRSPEHALNLNEKNFRVAFNFRQTNPRTMLSLNDPRYIRRVIRTRFWDNDNGEDYEKIIPFHDCTDEDYAQFYPIREDQKENFDFMREYPDRLGLICIDWDDSDPLQLFGSRDTTA